MTLSRSVIAALCVAALVWPAAAAAQQPPAEHGGGATFGDTTPFGGPAGLLGRTSQIKGKLAAAAGRTVAVQRLDPVRGWLALGQSAAGEDGAFTVTWQADVLGAHPLRTLIDGTPVDQATAAAARLLTTWTVYRPAMATWYGPGFYGKRTACGKKLTRTTRGVANKRLPCGTIVELHYGERTVRAPVIDRGPFRAGTHYDLTGATARDLGFDGVETIGALRVTPAPAQSARKPA